MFCQKLVLKNENLQTVWYVVPSIADLRIYLSNTRSFSSNKIDNEYFRAQKPRK